VCTTTRDNIYNTIHKSKKPLKVIAEEMGIDDSTLTRYGLEGPSGSEMPLSRLVPLTRSSSNFSVLDAIEHSLGRIGVLLPPPGRMPTADVACQVIKTVAEFGDLMIQVEKSVRDGKITDAERDKIRREGYQAAQAILTLVAACEAKIGR